MAELQTDDERAVAVKLLEMADAAVESLVAMGLSMEDARSLFIQHAAEMIADQVAADGQEWAGAEQRVRVDLVELVTHTWDSDE